MMEEERPMSGLSPVARMASPSRVFKKIPSSTAMRITAIPATTSFCCPPKNVPLKRSFAFVKTVSVLFMLRMEELPMTAMFTE